MKTQWFVIGRGKAGWHANGTKGDNTTVSGTGGTLEDYAAESADGTPVYDASEADYDAFADTVVRGPMADPKLPAGTVSRFMHWPAKTEPYQTTERVGPLDNVAVDVHLWLMFRNVPGVRFGVVQSGSVVWA